MPIYLVSYPPQLCQLIMVSNNCSKSLNRLQFVNVAIVVLITVCSIAYLISLALLIKRKDFQPLKSRSVSLIFVSTLGNFLYFSSMMYNKILQNNRWEIWSDLEYTNPKKPTVAIEMSCFFSNTQWWLFRAVWFVPYFFRSYRLNLIWGMQKSYYNQGRDAD